MRARAVFGFLFVALACAPLAHAQAPCSIHTITGTYAVQITGQSLIGSLVPSGAPYQLAGGEAVFVAKLTVSPDGSVQGPLWGVYVVGPVEVPFSGQATVNPDCTGDLVTPDESFKFVVLDNGKEIRWVPWDGFGGSVGTWHRITRADDPAPRCGRQTLSGNYMMRCEGFEFTGVDSGVASVWSLFVLSADHGTMSGKAYGKLFGLPVSTTMEMVVAGTYAVRNDCTMDMDLTFDNMPPGLSYRARGVVFDQGKEVLGVPLGIYAGDTPVAPTLPRTCVMTRMGR